ncbi:MAG: D-alanine--D-alanine ligase [Candidatus Omnitrophota bacterium]
MLRKNFSKIGVLMGGPSSEHKISLKSGRAVLKALKAKGINAKAIIIKSASIKENISLMKKSGIDCAFIALHGRFGEDGGIQGVLDKLKIPYTGSGVRASRLAMDKVASRLIFRKNGLHTPKFKVIKGKAKSTITLNNLAFPLVVKPALTGSSIGISIAQDQDSLKDGIKEAFKFDSRVIIEEYIRGRELTVGILGKSALPIVEIVTSQGFFDFKSKYRKGFTDYIVPAKLPKGISLKVKRAALSAHQLLGCYGCSRVDIILDSCNRPYILEINTIPGLTATSLLPKAAKSAGIDFNNLCLKLIQLAYEKAKV